MRELSLLYEDERKAQNFVEIDCTIASFARVIQYDPR